MTEEKHVLEVVLQNATVRMAVTGTVLSCTMAQPGPGRMEPIVTLDGKPYPAPENPSSKP